MNKRLEIIEELKATIPTVSEFIKEKYGFVIFDLWFLANVDENNLSMQIKREKEDAIYRTGVENVSDFSVENILKIVEKEIKEI